MKNKTTTEVAAAVKKAYDVLYEVYSNDNAGWDEAIAAIDEAIDYLGEVLLKP